MEHVMELLKGLMGTLLPYLFAFLVIFMFKHQISKVLLPNMQFIKFGDLEITFLKNSVKEMASKRIKSDISDKDASGPFLRARGIAPVLEGARLLWIDDNPENIINESKVFEKLGIEVDIATTSGEARKMLSRFNYDAILSDIKREGKNNEGTMFLESLIGTRMFRYTIFYVGIIDDKLPIPKGAFNITNRPDRLLHFVMDVLERERWQYFGSHSLH